MKTMIFAAGLGTRLKPITDHTPKALVKVNGRTLLEHVITKLIDSGVKDIIVNVHYLSHQIIDFLKNKNNFGIRIEISDESKQLLDTGGGLKKASWFFDDNKPFILYNVDILSNIDLSEMMQYHNDNNAIATLAVRKRESSRYLLSDSKNRLCGWENIKTKEKIITRNSKEYTQLAFSGIHIINPELFNYINNSGKFSIIDKYLELSTDHYIQVYNHDKTYWFDIGSINKLEVAEKYLQNN